MCFLSVFREIGCWGEMIFKIEVFTQGNDAARSFKERRGVVAVCLATRDFKNRE
jgi:hypothetical protein